VSVLSDVGLHRLGMDAITAKAGVSKATIYRRWARNEELLISILDDVSGDPLVDLPQSGSLGEDLCSLLTALAEVLAGPTGVVSRAILGALDTEPALTDAYRRGAIAGWRQAFTTVFGRATQRGEVEPGAGTTLAAESGPAILINRWLLTGRSIEPDEVAAVVDDVMMPFLERHRGQ
jgi:AcrR family transcriptional regulator